jgi:DNA polymerase II small subunit
VDGVGIYPNQESLLAIKDIRDQYSKLAELLGMIRKDVKLIMCPGQHDAVRVAEPQPPADRFFAEPLYHLENLTLVSNPALVNVGATGAFSGFKVLMYHGASFHSLINDIEELRIVNAHHSPSRVVKHILRKRHLSPTHSAVVYIPMETTDPLAITIVPDILTTGEIHRTDVSSYNNILTVCCSCWQSITPYEEKVGNEPDPCKVPVLNMKTGQINIMDFSGE